MSYEELHDALNVFLDGLLERKDALVMLLPLAEICRLLGVEKENTEEIEPEEREHLLIVGQLLLCLLFIRLNTTGGDT